MSDKIKCGLLQCLYVGIVVAVLEVAYLLVPLENPMLWTAFIPLAICFLTGASTVKDFVVLTLNCWFGVFGAWVIYQLIFGLMGSGMPMIPAFVIATVVIVFIAQFITMTLLGESGWGVCPMCFTGMVICFAANGQDLVVASLGAAFGVACGIVMVVLCGVAAKQVGLVAPATKDTVGEGKKQAAPEATRA